MRKQRLTQQSRIANIEGGEDCGCQERKEKLDNFKISRK